MFGQNAEVGARTGWKKWFDFVRRPAARILNFFSLQILKPSFALNSDDLQFNFNAYFGSIEPTSNILKPANHEQIL